MKKTDFNRLNPSTIKDIKASACDSLIYAILDRDIIASHNAIELLELIGQITSDEALYLIKELYKITQRKLKNL